MDARSVAYASEDSSQDNTCCPPSLLFRAKSILKTSPTLEPQFAPSMLWPTALAYIPRVYRPLLRHQPADSHRNVIQPRGSVGHRHCSIPSGSELMFQRLKRSDPNCFLTTLAIAHLSPAFANQSSAVIRFSQFSGVRSSQFSRAITTVSSFTSRCEHATTTLQAI